MKKMNFGIKRRKISQFENIPIHIILIIFAIISISPLYFLVVNVFKTNLEFSHSQISFPKTFYYENLVRAWNEGGFLKATLNSLFVTIISTFGRLFLGSMAAFAFATIDFKGKKLFYYLNLGVMFIPPIVVIIPLFKLMVKAKLISTFLAAIIVYIGYLPFTIFILISFFKTIPKGIIESAKIEGCSDFLLYLFIIIPLSKPALLTLGLLSLRQVWNDFLIPLIFIGKESKYTLMLKIVSFRGSEITDMGALFSGLFISILPLIIILILFQKYFVKGITLGSIK